MGYTIFTIVFSDGERQACITGGAVDFIRYPNGKGPNDVSSVLPHEGGRNAEQVGAPDWYWCLYSGEPFRPTRTAVQMFGGLSSITETLTVENHIIRYHMHWLIFKRRLGDLVREGKARQIPPPDGVCGRGYEWYLDVATGDVYRYGPPSPSAISEWMTAEPREIDSEKLNSVEMADRSGKNDMVIRRFMISLGDAGLVLSQRGSRGGWMLARDPKTITLEDIYRAVVRRPFIADSRKRSIPRVSQRLDRELRAVIDAASDTGSRETSKRESC
jgi:DNA-binding IscR family transcriptional regulator